jgi:hypothetical protein
MTGFEGNQEYVMSARLGSVSGISLFFSRLIALTLAVSLAVPPGAFAQSATGSCGDPDATAMLKAIDEQLASIDAQLKSLDAATAQNDHTSSLLWSNKALHIEGVGYAGVLCGVATWGLATLALPAAFAAIGIEGTVVSETGAVAYTAAMTNARAIAGVMGSATTAAITALTAQSSSQTQIINLGLKLNADLEGARNESTPGKFNQARASLNNILQGYYNLHMQVFQTSSVDQAKFDSNLLKSGLLYAWNPFERVLEKRQLEDTRLGMHRALVLDEQSRLNMLRQDIQDGCTPARAPRNLASASTQVLPPQSEVTDKRLQAYWVEENSLFDKFRAGAAAPK